MGMSAVTDLVETDNTFLPLRRGGQRLAVLVSLALVVLAAGAALFLVQGDDRQVDDVIRTYEVRNQARELTIVLTEAESSQRGYLLTREQSYRDAYSEASLAIDQRIAALQAATADEPERRLQVETIVRDIGSKRAEMARSIELVASSRSDQAQTLIETGVGARLMGDVKDALAGFIGQEDQKLLERNMGIDQSRRWLTGALLAALAGAVILAYSLFHRTRRQVQALSRQQDSLVSQNETLESKVIERTQALELAAEHAEHERQRVETLLQDTNHRIGNSLATVSSLLGLQLLRSKSDEVKTALEAARLRVHAIASAHRRLRLGGDLETTHADEFLIDVLDDIKLTSTASNAVMLRGEVDPIVMNARDATTIGILVAELVTNALKHAFPDGRTGTILVRLSRNAAASAVLEVVDDGIGLPEDADMSDGGLGAVIVKQLAQQFGGVPEYQRRSEGGLAVIIPLPHIEQA